MMPNRGYDMTPTMYSPDGRIYQVEYALETVKRGTLAIGIMTNDGIILAVDRILDMLRTSVNVTGDAAVACIVADSENLIDKNLFNK